MRDDQLSKASVYRYLNEPPSAPDWIFESVVRIPSVSPRLLDRGCQSWRSTPDQGSSHTDRPLRMPLSWLGKRSASSGLPRKPSNPILRVTSISEICTVHAMLLVEGSSCSRSMASN